MIVVRGKAAEEVPGEALRALAAAYDGVTVDVGAGDGRFAYRYAQAEPRRLVIALEPVRENVREMSSKAARRAERGGVANVLFVTGSIEHVPAELRGVANEIFVTLPWGSLMRGLILGEAAVLGGVASLGAAGARVRVVLNTRIFDDPVPSEAQDLPEVTPDYVRETLTSLYAAAGLRIERAAWMSANEVAALATTWAKRLSHRSPPRSVVIAATVAGELTPDPLQTR